MELPRDHYKKINGSWTPKRRFKRLEDIDKWEFNPKDWHRYICTFCGGYHISKIKRIKK